MSHLVLSLSAHTEHIVPIAILSWSIVTIFTGFVHNYAGLLACRLMLGMTEAVLFPGLNHYLSTLYTRDEFAKRVCTMLVATALSGAFGGLLAYGLLQMDGVSGVRGWRWLFIIQGILSLIIGVAAIFFLPNTAEQARFLTPEEKAIGRARLARQDEEVGDNKVQWKQVTSALTSPLVWVSGITQFGTNTCLYGEFISFCSPLRCPPVPRLPCFAEPD